MAFGPLQRHAGIKPYPQRPRHQRVVGETQVACGVFHDEGVVAQDGMAAKRDVAGRFQRIEPLA